ncbi:MAG: hypothetical protein Kow0031_33630 [Anaerolineae bacterium]
MKVKFLLIFGLLWLLPAAFPAAGQSPLSLQLLEADSSNFPEVTIDAAVRRNDIPQPGLAAANFAVFEDTGSEDRLTRVTEISAEPGLAISLVFDVDPTVDRSSFRPMQEWAQLVLDQIDTGNPNGPASHLLEVRASSGKVLSPFNNDLVAAKNGIRQMVIEDFNERNLNQTLNDALSADTQGRRQVVLLVGAGGDVLAINPVIDRALQKDTVINTVSFSGRADPTYLSTLAESTRGQFFNNPGNVSPTEIAASLFPNFQTLYRLTFLSGLHQTDQNQHTATVLAAADGAQSQQTIAYTFPQNGLRRAFNSLPLLWAYTLILGIAIIFLITRLFRLA